MSQSDAGIRASQQRKTGQQVHNTLPVEVSFLKDKLTIPKGWCKYVTSTGGMYRGKEHIKFDKEHTWEQQSSMKGSQQAISYSTM